MQARNCCIICYKNCDCCGESFNNGDRFSSRNEKEKVIPKFFELLARYLNSNEYESSKFEERKRKVRNLFEMFRKSNSTSEHLLHSCNDCLRILKGFCDLYHDLERIKLLLVWKLGTLTGIMNCARRAWPRVDNLKRCLQTGSELEPEAVLAFKKKLEKTCRRKLLSTNSFPKLKLEKLWENSEPQSHPFPASVTNDDVKGSKYNDDNDNDPNSQTPLGLNNSLERNKTEDEQSNGENLDQSLNLNYFPATDITEKMSPSADRTSGSESSKDIASNPNPNSGHISKNPDQIQTAEKDSNSNEAKEEPGSEIRTEVSANTNIAPNGNANANLLQNPGPDHVLRSIHKCQRCPRTFAKLERLQTHQMTCSGSEFPDDFEVGTGKSDCGSSFEAPYDLNNDDDDHQNNAEEESSSSSDEDEEERIPVKKKPLPRLLKTGPANKANFTCGICEKQFLTKTRLKEHALKTHEKDGTFRCNFCAEEFPHLAGFRSHLKLKHAQKDSKLPPISDQVTFRFQCPDPGCSELFYALHLLLLHRKNKLKPEVKHETEKQDTEKIFPPISVKILLFPRLAKPLLLDTALDYATVEVPQDVYFCKSEGCNWKPLYSKQDFLEHSRLHGEFTCAFCPKVEIFALDLARHELESHGTPQKCPRCSATFNNKKPVGQKPSPYLCHFVGDHLGLSGPAAINYSCAVCKTYGETKPQSLFRHYKDRHNNSAATQNGNIIVRCNFQLENKEGRSSNPCPAYFRNSPAALALHQRLWHNHDPIANRDRFKCRDCQKVLNCVGALRHHRKRFHNVKLSVKCKADGCPLMFELEGDMERHFKYVHWDGLKPGAKCGECGKEFVSETGLRNHIRLVHQRVGSKPRRRKLGPAKGFVCETCGKSFREKHKLQIHFLWHSGPDSWEFTCEVCGKKCISSEKLREHLRTHGDEKPYACQVCEQKYKHRHNLRIHVNNKHGDKVKDIPKKYDRSNLTSRKGIKRKRNG